MKMWSIRVVLVLLVCYPRLISNATVYFVSQNFHNILHWEPVKTASPQEKVLYSVWYKSDATEKYQLKEECHNITALSCDLTAETVSVYDVQYKARVTANGSIHGKTLKFKPIAETILGPPRLSINITPLSLHINVMLPLGPNGVSIADIINRSTILRAQSVIRYTLKITEPKSAELVQENQNGRFVVPLKSNISTYCGYVVYAPIIEHGRPKSQNASFCVPVPADSRRLLAWLLTGAAFLAAIVIVLVVCTYNYVKGGKHNSMPQSLVTAPGTTNKVLQPQDRKLSISKPEFYTPVKTPYPKIPPGVKPIVSISNGGYSPQDFTVQAWTGSSVGTDEHGPNVNTQDTSAQSSEIYSVVVVNKDNKDFQQVTTGDASSSNLPSSSSSHGQPWNKGGMRPTTTATLSDQDATESNEAGPLLLTTVRDPNGQLTLSSPFPLLQSSTGAGAPLLTSERKPLLSDLIDTKEGPTLALLLSCESLEWSDSGCDDNTIDTPIDIPSPSLTVDFLGGCVDTPGSDATSESGYKQNWMSEILVQARGNNGCEYKSTNHA